jgi:hypothetical protein
MKSKLIARLSRLEQSSSSRSASIEQEMLSKALGSLSDADLDHIYNLAKRGGLSAEPTPEESSAVERLKVFCVTGDEEDRSSA